MPHKVYDKNTINEAKLRIEYYKKMRDYAKAIKSGDKDSLKFALEIVRDMEATARYTIFGMLKKALPQGDSLARFNLGLMEAYQSVLTLFEKPDQFFAHHEQEIQADERFIKEAELHNKVDGG